MLAPWRVFTIGSSKTTRASHWDHDKHRKTVKPRWDEFLQWSWCVAHHTLLVTEKQRHGKSAIGYPKSHPKCWNWHHFLLFFYQKNDNPFGGYYFWFWMSLVGYPVHLAWSIRFLNFSSSKNWVSKKHPWSSYTNLRKQPRFHRGYWYLFMSILPTIWKKKEVSLSTSRMARLPQALSAERHVVSIPGIVKSAQLSDQIVTADFELQKVIICVSFNHNFRYLK